jgi:hypothetical protein
MPRFRFVGLTILALVLAATVIQTGWSEGDKPPPAGEAGKDDCSGTVYPLRDLGDDPQLCPWIAETITRVIAPGTWGRAGAEGKDKGTLSYYAPGKILVVRHTPAVQAKVRAFLDELKKSLPAENGKVKQAAGDDRGVVPSSYEEPVPVRAAAPRSLVPSYPVPARSPQPKHLFHFIIRYEGEGIIDDTVAGVLKELYGGKQAAKQDTEGTPCRSCSAPSAPLAAPSK